MTQRELADLSEGLTETLRDFGTDLRVTITRKRKYVSNPSRLHVRVENANDRIEFCVVTR